MTAINPDARPAGRALLDAPQLAAEFGISVSSIYRKRSLGEPLPPAIRIGNAVRWRREDVDAWLAEQTEEAS